MKILRGSSDANIAFEDMRSLLLHFGFEERIRGSHHIFSRFDIPEILNIQPKGSLAKPYQVKQVRQLIVRNKLDSIIEDGKD
jgi:predicted RNA binding protein YcfA (HicA-like mRNA interferase family)